MIKSKIDFPLSHVLGFFSYYFWKLCPENPVYVAIFLSIFLFLYWWFRVPGIIRTHIDFFEDSDTSILCKVGNISLYVNVVQPWLWYDDQFSLNDPAFSTYF